MNSENAQSGPVIPRGKGPIQLFSQRWTGNSGALKDFRKRKENPKIETCKEREGTAYKIFLPKADLGCLVRKFRGGSMWKFLDGFVFAAMEFFLDDGDPFINIMVD